MYAAPGASLVESGALGSMFRCNNTAAAGGGDNSGQSPVFPAAFASESIYRLRHGTVAAGLTNADSFYLNLNGESLTVTLNARL